jgi:hypothetical protein
MRGREKLGIRLLVAAVLAAVLAGVVVAPAVAKKKKRPPAVTAAASAPLAPASPASATANCPGKRHVTGGGWSISNPYSANGTDAPADDLGTRITHLQSQPAGFFGWSAGAAALSSPPSPTTFSAYARCEGNAYGRTLSGVAGTSTVPIGQQTTNDIRCPRGTHVLTAGFSFGPPGDLAGPLGSKRAIVKESRRIAADAWRVGLVNPIDAPSEVTLSVNVLCELNTKGTGVSEASAVAPILDNGRTTATATCTGKTHSVAGGFAVSPAVGPAIGIDQMQPVDAKAWQVGLFEYPTFLLPAGSSVAAYSYCKKNALPKKKRK